MTVHARCTGKGGQWWYVGGNVFAWVCARNYSGAQFIVPILGLIPNTSMATGHTEEWESELHWLCGSMTSWMLLQSGHWPIQIHVKWVPRGFLPWFESISIVRIEYPFRESHPLRGQSRWMFLLLVAVLNVLILFLLIPMILDIIHWLKLLGIRVRITIHDINDGIIMDFL